MALSHGRVVAVGETLYPHEQEGIDFAIQVLPDTDPYHMWALIDLLDKATGRYIEIDPLILGYSCLYLVELKAWPGRIEGDSIDGTWTAPEGRPQWKENPLRLARRKAQILKSRLERAMPPGVRAPWILDAGLRGHFRVPPTSKDTFRAPNGQAQPCPLRYRQQARAVRWRFGKGHACCPMDVSR